MRTTVRGSLRLYLLDHALLEHLAELDGTLL